MSHRIEETFQLRAPVDRVWTYLVDPRQVVDCLPGAELTDVQSDTTFLGRVKVKVGPVTAAYNGKVTITARNDGAHVVSMVGEGRESGGAGSAKMTMTSRLATLPGGDTEVRVTADVDVVGKAAQFGRGMIESVNKQLFKQFTECVKGTLEQRATGANGGEVAVTSAAPSTVTDNRAPTARMPGGATAAGATTTSGVAVKPVSVLPLVLRALAEKLERFARSIWAAVFRFRRKPSA